MHVRILFVRSLLLVLTVLVPLLPPGATRVIAEQGSLNVQLVSQFGGSSKAVAVRGNYAFTGFGASLLVLDISNPSNPSLVGKSPQLPGLVQGIAVSGNYAYLTIARDGLYIVDVSNLSLPTLVGSLSGLGDVLGIAVAGSYAYVNNGNLVIIDVSNPVSPFKLGSYSIWGGSSGKVTIVGTRAYVAAGSAGLHIVDVSNPFNPARVGSWNDAYGYVFGIEVKEDYAFVLGGPGGLRIIDVSNPSSPTRVGLLYMEDSGSGLAIVGKYAYVSGRDRILVIDVSTKASPFVVGSHPMWNTAGSPHDVVVLGSFVYLAAGNIGLRILDVSSPSAPREIGFYDSPGDAQAIALAGNHVYIAGYKGLSVVDVTAPDSPASAGTVLNPNWHAHDVAVSGNFAYFLDNWRTLLIVDISNPRNPSLISNWFALPNSAGGVAAAGNYAFVNDSWAGLYIIDVSNPKDPKLAGQYPMIALGSGITASNNYVYVLDRFYRQMHIIDVSNPSIPREVGTFQSAGTPYDIVVVQNRAYLADYGSLRVLDVSDPAQVREIGSIAIGGNAVGVAVWGNYAYVSTDHAGLRVINLSDPTNLVEVGFYDTPGQARGVAVNDRYAFVADNENGLMILQFSGAVPTYSISGRVTDANGNGIYGVTVSASPTVTTTTDSSGHYTLANLSAGTYSISVSKSGFTFSPPSRSGISVPSNPTGVNFVGSANGLQVHDFPVETKPTAQSNPAISENLVVWSDTNEKAIYSYDLTTGLKSVLIKPFSGYSVVALALYNRTLAWIEDNGTNDYHVYALNISTNAKTELWRTNWATRHIDVSGDNIVWESAIGLNRYLYGHNLRTGTTSELKTFGQCSGCPLPDASISGNRVAYVGGDGSINVLDLLTNTERRIVSPWYFPQQGIQVGNASPDIDGNLVVWRDSRAGPYKYEIYGYDISTGKEFSVSTGNGEKGSPKISGTLVVWLDDRNGAEEIYGKDLVSGTEFRVTSVPQPIGISPPNWPLDISGNTAVWVDHRNGNPDIYGARIFTPPTYSITGSATDANNVGIEGVTISYGSGLSVPTYSDGKYTIPNLAPGTYTLTPSKTQFAFSPPSAPNIELNSNVSGKDFVGTWIPPTYSISGQVTAADNIGIEGVLVFDNAGHSDVTDSNGLYNLHGLLAGVHTIGVIKEGYIFREPWKAGIMVPSGFSVDFQGKPLVQSHISISHSVQDQASEFEGARVLRIKTSLPNATITRFDGNGQTVLGQADGEGTLYTTYDAHDSPLVGSPSPVFYANTLKGDWDGTIFPYSVTLFSSERSLTLDDASAYWLPVALSIQSLLDSPKPNPSKRLSAFRAFIAYVKAMAKYEPQSGDTIRWAIYEYKTTVPNVPIAYRLYLHVERSGETIDSISVFSTDPGDLLFGVDDFGNFVAAKAASPVNIMLTDPQGRQTGLSPVTHQVVNEIPDSFYTGPGTEPQVILVLDAAFGNYVLTTVGTGSGPVNLDIGNLDVPGRSQRESTVFFTNPDQLSNWPLTYPRGLVDPSPPIISAAVAPPPNPAGWNNTDVSVSWAISDPESGIASSFGCGGATLLDNTAATTETCTATNGSGVYAYKSKTVRVDKTMPMLNFGAFYPQPNAAGWNNSDVSIPFTDSDGMSGVASTDPPSSPLRLATEGSIVSGTVRVTDVASNSATFTSPVVRIDKTAPATTDSLSSSLGANGWYTSPVTVALIAADNISGIASTTYTIDGSAPQSYSAPFAVTTDGAHTVSYHSTDNAGNVEVVQSVSFKIDKTAPTIAGSRSPLGNAYGWNSGDVAVSFTCSDATSGIASCPSVTTLRADGANQSVNGIAADNAGNSASAAVSGINIDKTKPTIVIDSPTTGPYLTSQSITLNFTTSDTLSGIDTASARLDGVAVSKGQVISLAAMAGNHRFTVTTRDKAENEETCSVDFTVLIAASVDVKPDTLNTKSQSGENAVTAYIEFPVGYDVNLVNVSTVKLAVNGIEVPAQLSPTSIGDYDNDRVADRMVKFDRQAVITALGGRTGDIAIGVHGQLADGRGFVASDIVKVIAQGPAKN